MINLIPPTAKKSIHREYLKRVATVWLFLFSVALTMLTIFLLPTYVALQREITSLETTTAVSSDRVSQFDISATELIKTNNQAMLLLHSVTTITPSKVISTLSDTAGSQVKLTNFQFSNLDTTGKVTISGVAVSRQDLAVFRDAVSADSRFSEVNLPISNLIKDRDLLFSMSMTISSTTRL